MARSAKGRLSSLAREEFRAANRVAEDGAAKEQERGASALHF